MMKPRFFNPALALTMACLIALPAAPGRAETPADTLVVADTIDDIISLDPAQSFELSGGDVIRNLYDRLVDFDPLDLGAGIQPSLASAWQVSEDGRTITLTLREGALFQSGNPVRAEDAAWSLQRVVKLDRAPAFILTQFGFTPGNVDQKITASGNQLVIELDRAYAPSLVLNSLAANAASVLDKETLLQHAMGEDLGHGWLSVNAAGSGPYSLAEWHPNERVGLSANAAYWQGAPLMQQVVLRNVPDSGLQRQMLEQGDIDVARELAPEDIAVIGGDADLAVLTAATGRILYLGLNQKDPLLSRPEMIEAMRYLVDYAGLQQGPLKGQWALHQNFLPSGYLGASEENPWAYDPDKARAILRDAGITSGAITAAMRDRPEYVELAKQLKNTMEPLGLTLHIRPMDGSQALQVYRARQVPLYIGEWAPDYADPNTNAASFASNPDNSDEAMLSQLAWRNAWAVPAEMNQATAAAALEPDTEKRAQIYQDIQRQYREIAPIIPLFQQIEQVGMRGNIRNWNSGGAVTSASYRQVSKEGPAPATN